jgi:hypothetical protein
MEPGDVTVEPQTVDWSSTPTGNSGGFRPLGPQPGFAPLGDTGGFVNADGTPVEEPPTFRATVSAYYYLNQSSTVITELDTNSTTEDDEVLQNSLILTFDMSDEYKSDAGTFSWRMNGDYAMDFTDGGENRFGLSRLYGDYAFGEEGGTSVRFGRQSRNGGGVLGRFDGVQLTYPVTGDVTLKAVAGIPVDSKRDDLFGGNRTLLGLSADIANLWQGVELSGFIVNEQREGYTNRFAIGAEGQ